jgi:hypothetical protein
MGVRAVWLADAARLTGYPVLEVAGWRTRGHGSGFRVIEGVVLHHTADGPTGNYPSLGVVRDGRAGLAGPLSNLGLGRDGTVLVIAAGVAWHAGASAWVGYRDLNDTFLGIEAESVGVRDDWTPAQRDCYPRLVAACLFYLRRGADRAAGHKEVALPAGRKIDPAFWDLAGLRKHVSWLLADPVARIPRFAKPAPTPPPPPDAGDDDMGMQQFPIPAAPGVRSMRLIVPTGSASSVTGRAWISMVVNGPYKGSGRVWAQSDTAGISDRWFNMDFTEGRSSRDWWELPSGTTQISVHYDMPDGGCITLEWAGK